MTNQSFAERYIIIDELTRLIKTDRARVKQLMDLDEDVLDIFEALDSAQREYLAENFHQVFSLNEEALSQVINTFKQPN